MIFLNKAILSAILLFLGGIVNAQDIFMCDTTGKVRKKDSIISFNCDYYYNIIKQSKDSVLSVNSLSASPVTVVATVKGNKLNGPIRFLRSDSNTVMQGFMRNGLADSTFILYHISLGNYKREAMKSFFRNGLKEGEETEYNDKGVIIFIRNYHEGMLEGVYKHFDDYGHLVTSGTYKAGKKEEVWTENDLDKNYSVIYNYKNDEIIDYNWKAYYNNGKVFFEGNYDKDGKKQGIFSTYDAEGFLISTDTYKNGMRNGYTTEYYYGKAVKKTKYKNDQVVKE